jgi:regulator of protease activity HflC (stomatin/prohibitin superfamily)
VVDVRYRLDVARLPDMFTRLSGPAEERVALAVASAAREVLPNYLVRETFATRRDKIRQLTAAGLAKRLSSDAITVVDVALRDVVLPPEYAKGMEGLLLKEQENERMVFDLQIKEKEVKAAELVAEAEKAREVKRAEAAAAKVVLQAKAEADAMQHTLPLKEKQIQQSRLEAEARKETTLKNAEAAAQAKVIDSKAEVERQKLLADAEATRIRVTGAADAERLRREAAVLQDNPLIIQKIVAQRLSDKMQIMMVPMDGNSFFANDVFRAVNPVRQRQAQETPAASGSGEVRPAPTARSARR